MGIFSSSKVTTKNAAKKSATAGNFNDKKVADVYFHLNTREGIGPESSHGWLQICSVSEALKDQEHNDPILAAEDLRAAAGKSQKYFDRQLETMLGFAAYEGSTTKGHVIEPDFQIKPESTIRYSITGAQYKAMFAYINDKREHRFSSSYNSLTFASHALQAAGITGVESITSAKGAKKFLTKENERAKKEKEKGAFKQDIGLQGVRMENKGTLGHKRDMAESVTNVAYDRYYGGFVGRHASLLVEDNQQSFFQDKGGQQHVANHAHRKAYMKLSESAKSRVNEGQRRAFANWISDSGSFSKYLRNGDQSKEESMRNKVQMMDAVFEQEESALPVDMTVYRGVNDGMIKYLLEKKGINPTLYQKGNAFDIGKAKATGALNALKGMSYSDQCYVSTSTNKGYAIAWNQLSGNVDQQANYKAKSGASKSQITNFRNANYDSLLSPSSDGKTGKQRMAAWCDAIKGRDANIKKQYKDDVATLDNLSQTGAGHIMTIKLPKGTRGVFSDAMAGANQNEITLDRGLKYNISDFTINSNGNMELNMSVTGYSKHRKSYGKYDADTDTLTPEQTERLNQLIAKVEKSNSPEAKAEYEKLQFMPLSETINVKKELDAKYKLTPDESFELSELKAKLNANDSRI